MHELVKGKTYFPPELFGPGSFRTPILAEWRVLIRGDQRHATCRSEPTKHEHCNNLFNTGINSMVLFITFLIFWSFCFVFLLFVIFYWCFVFYYYFLGGWVTTWINLLFGYVVGVGRIKLRQCSKVHFIYIIYTHKKIEFIIIVV